MATDFSFWVESALRDFRRHPCSYKPLLQLLEEATVLPSRMHQVQSAAQSLTSLASLPPLQPYEPLHHAARCLLRAACRGDGASLDAIPLPTLCGAASVTAPPQFHVRRTVHYSATRPTKAGKIGIVSYQASLAECFAAHCALQDSLPVTVDARLTVTATAGTGTGGPSLRPTGEMPPIAALIDSFVGRPSSGSSDADAREALSSRAKVAADCVGGLLAFAEFVADGLAADSAARAAKSNVASSGRHDQRTHRGAVVRPITAVAGFGRALLSRKTRSYGLACTSCGRTIVLVLAGPVTVPLRLQPLLPRALLDDCRAIASTRHPEEPHHCITSGASNRKNVDPHWARSSWPIGAAAFDESSPQREGSYHAAEREDHSLLRPSPGTPALLSPLLVADAAPSEDHFARCVSIDIPASYFPGASGNPMASHGSASASRGAALRGAAAAFAVVAAAPRAVRLFWECLSSDAEAPDRSGEFKEPCRSDPTSSYCGPAAISLFGIKVTTSPSDCYAAIIRQSSCASVGTQSITMDRGLCGVASKLVHQVEPLIAARLAQGGSLTNWVLRCGKVDMSSVLRATVPNMPFTSGDSLRKYFGQHLWAIVTAPALSPAHLTATLATSVLAVDEDTYTFELQRFRPRGTSTLQSSYAIDNRSTADVVAAAARRILYDTELPPFLGVAVLPVGAGGCGGVATSSPVGVNSRGSVCVFVGAGRSLSALNTLHPPASRGVSDSVRSCSCALTKTLFPDSTAATHCLSADASVLDAAKEVSGPAVTAKIHAAALSSNHAAQLCASIVRDVALPTASAREALAPASCSNSLLHAGLRHYLQFAAARAVHLQTTSAEESADSDGPDDISDDEKLHPRSALCHNPFAPLLELVPRGGESSIQSKRRHRDQRREHRPWWADPDLDRISTVVDGLLDNAKKGGGPGVLSGAEVNPRVRNAVKHAVRHTEPVTADGAEDDVGSPSGPAESHLQQQHSNPAGVDRDEEPHDQLRALFRQQRSSTAGETSAKPFYLPLDGAIDAALEDVGNRIRARMSRTVAAASKG